MVVCHTTFWGITSVTAVYILIAFADYSTVKFVIEFEDSTRWALLRIINVPNFAATHATHRFIHSIWFRVLLAYDISSKLCINYHTFKFAPITRVFMWPNL